MTAKLAWAALVAAFLIPGMARAGDCEPMAVALKAHPEIASAKPAKGAQFWFAAGVFAGSPDTPAELPHGDRAVSIDKSENGRPQTTIVFMSEGMVCEAFTLGGDMRKAFMDAGEGKMNMPGDGT